MEVKLLNGKVTKVIGGLGAALGLLIALTPFQLAPVCQRLLELTSGKMTHMRCHYTGQGEVFLGIVVVLVSLIYLFNTSIPAQKALGGVLMILGCAVIILPTNLGIGVCMNPMECHTTARVLYVLGSLTIIDGLVAVFQEKLPVSPSKDIKA
ncbi:DUF4418 family protein [Desulfitobacterium hafniense]|uniref:DUF4418 domain-containing protein n=4 Tax=root TaxID=1 RepID=Q251J7_DESHY|nr:DUF4418 family protein [Desulfitobacterium hafniense]EHL09050.1 hypothetical protein HMPREF0322_00236 [Desulfitobacterium hafniense DP7]KTE92325.1 hypothetical protein AT727_20055 [Desulfitobacterium hafniense]MEA5024408.1 DUF4418 family protein [Desulfitobacterium hafniense]BAE82045.1 hypothetical protein DSY0256 [Desulfitobacterium hafniense Y51]